MDKRKIRLLHVEDDPIQQKILAHHLQAAGDVDFQIATATGEEAALAALREGHFDLVVLDYRLEQGDGLALLRRLRQCDPIMPVIAISGVATSRIAGELIEAGADDYFNKHEFSSRQLLASVRAALQRADIVRDRRRQAASLSDCEEQLCAISRTFIRAAGAQMAQLLDHAGKSFRELKLDHGQLAHVFRRVGARVEADNLGSFDPDSVVLPLLLELCSRILAIAAKEALRAAEKQAQRRASSSGLPLAALEQPSTSGPCGELSQT
jgi:DNA-binding response OmpR family regulator